MAARFIPTVERESIDLVDSNVSSKSVSLESIFKSFTGVDHSSMEQGTLMRRRLSMPGSL